MYSETKFSKVSLTKIKEWVFVDFQIGKLLKDDNFENTLNVLELDTRPSFRNVFNGLFGMYKSTNYKLLIQKMIDSYELLRCNMSLKVHIGHMHLFFFPQNAVEIIREHFEIFQQYISQM